MNDCLFSQVEASARPLTAAASYRLWLPPLSGALRVLFVVNQRGAGRHLFWRDAEWQNLAARMAGGLLYCEFEAATVQENGYGQSVVHACEQFARLVGRPELAAVPWMLWGHSMGGRAVQDFVRWQPERVAAFCIAMRRYPTPPELMGESAEAMKVPGLYLMGADDRRPPDIRAHFEHARSHNAPRAWAMLPGQGHWPPGMDMTRDDTSPADWRA